VVFVRGLLVVGQPEDGVFEGEQHSGVDVEGEVQIDRTSATLLGVQVHLPNLSERIGLDEMTLVVDMEAVIDRVVLQVGDVASNVDSCHSQPRLVAVELANFLGVGSVYGRPCPARGPVWGIDGGASRPRRDSTIGASTASVRDSIGSTLPPTRQRSRCSASRGSRSSRRSPAERTDHSHLLAVLDPIDGSTNAHRGIPIYSTSICVFDADGPRVGTVVNHCSGSGTTPFADRVPGATVWPSHPVDLRDACRGRRWPLRVGLRRPRRRGSTGHLVARHWSSVPWPTGASTRTCSGSA
jgi:hypothetical protein